MGHGRRQRRYLDRGDAHWHDCSRRSFALVLGRYEDGESRFSGPRNLTASRRFVFWILWPGRRSYQDADRRAGWLVLSRAGGGGRGMRRPEELYA